MNLTFNAFNPTFNALLVSPNGEKVIDNMHRNHRFNLKGYIEEQQKKMKDYKYVDGIITGRPDEYGDLRYVLYIKDKVTGETFRKPFRVDRTDYPHIVETEDGQTVPENVTVLKDGKGNTRYFSYINEYGATRFEECALGEQPFDYLKLGVIDAMEYYYRNRIGNDKTIRDNYADLVISLKQNKCGPLHKLVPDIIKDENLLGKGREKDVYKIDNLNGYVLCVIRDKYNPDMPITPFKQCIQTFSVIGTDFPIVMNDNGMYIKKYVGGKSHSVPNWLEKFTGSEFLSHNDIQYFVNSLKELSEFPVKSYIDFAKSLQKLNKERIRIDTINPNNIIIDNVLKTIKIIDFGSKDNTVPLGTTRPINGLSDMEAILCDSIMYTRYYARATEEERQKLDEYAKTIINKCRVAAKVSNIGNYPLNTENYLKCVEEQNKNRNRGALQNLRAFKNHFKDVLSKEIVSTEFEGYFDNTKAELIAKTNASFEYQQ